MCRLPRCFDDISAAERGIKKFYCFFWDALFFVFSFICVCLMLCSFNISEYFLIFLFPKCSDAFLDLVVQFLQLFFFFPFSLSARHIFNANFHFYILAVYSYSLYTRGSPRKMPLWILTTARVCPSTDNSNFQFIMAFEIKFMTFFLIFWTISDI